MGLLKDMWDILKDEPEVRNWIKTNAKEAYHILKPYIGREKKHKSLREMQNQQTMIIPVIKEPEFPKKFSNRLSLLEFLLCQVVRSVESKERGMLIQDFYLDKHILYFPMSSYERKTFKRTFIFSYSYSGFITKVYKSATPDYYKFYVIDGNYDRNKEFPKIKEILDKVVRRERQVSELEDFKKELDNLQLSLDPITGLYFFLRQQSFAFGYDRIHLEGAKYFLSFEDPNTTRKRIYEDLIYLLNFR